MYVTAANNLTALDARTGRELWKHVRPVSSGLIDDAAAHKNRGVGIWKNRVYMETDDAHLLCLDQRSGRVLWDVTYADSRKGYGATSAPSSLKTRSLWALPVGTAECAAFSRLTMPQQGKCAGNSGRCRLLASSVRQAGLETLTSTVEVQHGCQALMIQSRRLCTGLPAIQGPTL